MKTQKTQQIKVKKILQPFKNQMKITQEILNFMKPQYKIMNTIAQDRIVLTQKQRKQQYYKQMLDQQVNYNSRSKYEASKQSYRPDNGRTSNYYGRQSFNEPYYENEGYLPPIRTQKGASYKPQNVSMRQRSEQDKTQIYLKNCQYIIKNLRQLKHKREKDQFLTMSTQPTPHEELPKQPKAIREIQYYPRNQYFSSQGKAYNKIYPVEPSQKMHNLRNSQDESFYKSYQNSNKKIRTKTLPQKIIKKHIVNKLENEPKEDKNMNLPDMLVDSSQSEIPNGFEDKRKYGSKQQSRKLSKTNMSVQTKSPLSKEREQEQEEKQQSQRQTKDQEYVTVQRQLVLCLTQLTRFLKNQNSGKIQGKNELNQNNLLDKQQKATKKEDSSQLQLQKNHPQAQNTRQNDKLQGLKYQAIVALKKLNSKSKQFLELASNRSHGQKPKEQKPLKKHASVQYFNDDLDKSTKLSNQNPQRKNQEEKLKQLIAIPVWLPINQSTPRSSTESEVMLHSTQNKQQQSQNKQTNVNSELAKQLVSYLSKQQNQNFQLSFCLKQLTQYLKIQNEEMNQLKTSRQVKERQQLLKHSGTSYLYEKKPGSREEQEQAAMQKIQTNKLQQAVLKKLKKARLRGNIFKEKVEKFRKEHHHIITTKKQASLKQEENEVQIKPITVSTNLKQINQKDQNQEEQKESPIADQQKKTPEVQSKLAQK